MKEKRRKRVKIRGSRSIHSLYFSLLAGNSRRRRVRARLLPPPVITAVTLDFQLNSSTGPSTALRISAGGSRSAHASLAPQVRIPPSPPLSLQLRECFSDPSRIARIPGLFSLP